MEEFVYRAIERVGFPIAVSLVSFWCVYKLFQMREKERSDKNDALTLALAANTASLEANTELLRKKLGSDPDGAVCRYNEEQRKLQAMLEARGIELTAREQQMLLEQRERDARRKLEQAERECQ